MSKRRLEAIAQQVAGHSLGYFAQVQRMGIAPGLEVQAQAVVLLLLLVLVPKLAVVLLLLLVLVPILALVRARELA